MGHERPASARDRLLAAARERFYADGIGATGIDRLLGHAGVAKRSLYHHFTSKDELVVRVLEQRHEEWQRRLEAAIDAHPGPEARLLAVFDAYESYARAEGFRGCGFVNAAAEFGDRSHPAHAVVRAHKQSVVAVLTELASEARLSEPADLAEQLFLLLEGGFVAAGIRGRREPLDHARAAARTLIDARR